MPIKKGKIGNALESVAPDHTVAVAADIFDETLNKYQSELNQQIGQGGYNPPQGGIPKSDLSSSVQASLDKADAAVPNTRAVNGKALSANITLNASDVGALPSSTTIPTSLSQLNDDSTHRTVTDSEKTNWSDKYTKTEVDNMISSAPESDVIVVDVPSGSDIATYLLNNVPAAQRPNNIFRVPGTNSFSEWAWNGTAFSMLDEKNYGVDNIETAGSANVIESGAVYTVKNACINELEDLKVHLLYKSASFVTNGDQIRQTSAFGLKQGKTYVIKVSSSAVITQVSAVFMYKDPSFAISNTAENICMLTQGNNSWFNVFTLNNDYMYLGIYSPSTNVNIEIDIAEFDLSEYTQRTLSVIGDVVDLTAVNYTNGKYLLFSNNEVREVPADTWSYSDFIDVSGMNTIILGYTAELPGVIYDSNHDPIRGLDQQVSSENINKIFTLPENAAYIRYNRPIDRPKACSRYYMIKSSSSSLLSYITNVSKIPLLETNVNKLNGKINNLFVRSTYIDGKFAYISSSFNYSIMDTVPDLNMTDYIDVEGVKLLYVSGCAGTISVVFYNSDKVFIDYQNTPDTDYDQYFRVPPLAKYAVVNFMDSQLDNLVICDAKYVLNRSVYNLYINPALVNKKIAWYGTSIPDGFPYYNMSYRSAFAYPNIVACHFGAKIQNRSVSGGFIISKSNTEYQGNQSVRFTDLTSTHNYKTDILDIIGTNSEPDIFVFDWGANDGQFYQNYFDNVDIDSLDMTSVDTSTFLGAYNFIIKQTLQAKPTARIVLCTHYSDDGQSNEMTRTDGYKKMNDMICKIAEYWHLPVNEVRNKTGWIYGRNGISNIRNYCNDGIHPASNYNRDSINILANIHIEFIESIFGEQTKSLH